MVKTNSNKFTIYLKFIVKIEDENGKPKTETLKVDSLNISEYNCYRNPLKRVESIHKLKFIDVPSILTDLLYKVKKDEDIEIAIKIECRNIYENITDLVMNNVLKCVSIKNLGDFDNATSKLEINAVGLIAFNMRKMNSLTSFTPSPLEEEPIILYQKTVSTIFKQYKRQLQEMHGETLGFDLADDESSSNFVYEYIKVPTQIMDIDIFDYVFAHYDGYYFPQFFFVDDCPFGIKTSNPPKSNTLFRQFDLGAIHKRETVDVYSNEMIPFIDHGRKMRIFEKPFLNASLMDEDLNKSTRVVTNTQTEEIKVYNRPDSNIYYSKLSNSNENDFLSITLDSSQVKNQKNINIISNFEEYEKIHKGREIFRIGNPPGSEEQVIPRLITFVLENTSPYYVNFGNRYNFIRKDVFDCYPIDINFRLEKEKHSNITFFSHTEVTFFVTEKQDLNQYL